MKGQQDSRLPLEFELSGVHDSVTIYNGELVFRLDKKLDKSSAEDDKLYDFFDKVVEEFPPLSGTVKYTWYPSPGVKVEVSGYNISSLALAMLTNPDETPIKIPGFPEVIFRFTSVTSGPLNSGGIGGQNSPENQESFMQLEGVIEELKTPNSDSANFLDFHIINGASFNFDRKGRVVTELNKEWLVRIEPCPRKPTTYENLKEHSAIAQAQEVTAGRYNISHICRISHLDKEDFNPDSPDVSSILSTFAQAFSIITGQWVAPTLLTLRNSKGNLVGNIFRPAKVDPSINPRGSGKSLWFANLDSKMFEQLLKCFWEHKSDRHISQAVFWYIKAHKAETPEEALITLQVPLESLAWWYMVDQKQALTAEGFNSLRAGEWLRLFLTFLSIPTKIPLHFKALKMVQGDYFDGPHALVAFRNYVTHPSQKNRTRLKSLPVGALAEVESLGKFYLELAILHLIDYKGEFCSAIEKNRFNPVDVPWAKSD